ncbi:MAG: cell division protein ZapA [Methylococcales bacterium]|nr:cell division protein ZapA [Methylococcales bacterium]
MNQPANIVAITILDKDYRIVCPPQEQDDLKAAARWLDRQMRDIKQTGKVTGNERIAVMAALNMAHDLFTAEQRIASLEQQLKTHVQRLDDKLQAVLENQ